MTNSDAIDLLYQKNKTDLEKKLRSDFDNYLNFGVGCYLLILKEEKKLQQISITNQAKGLQQFNCVNPLMSVYGENYDPIILILPNGEKLEARLSVAGKPNVQE